MQQGGDKRDAEDDFRVALNLPGGHREAGVTKARMIICGTMNVALDEWLGFIPKETTLVPTNQDR